MKIKSIDFGRASFSYLDTHSQVSLVLLLLSLNRILLGWSWNSVEKIWIFILFTDNVKIAHKHNLFWSVSSPYSLQIRKNTDQRKGSIYGLFRAVSFSPDLIVASVWSMVQTYMFSDLQDDQDLKQDMLVGWGGIFFWNFSGGEGGQIGEDSMFCGSSVEGTCWGWSILLNELQK